MKNSVNKKMTIATKRNYKLLSDALFALMSKRSFNSISVVDICEKAMVPRATFYNHFEDKFDLLRYSFREKIDTFEAGTEDYVPGTQAYFEVILSKVIDYLIIHKELFIKMLRADDNMGIMELQKLISSKFYEGFYRSQEKVEFNVPLEPLSEFYAGAIIFTIKWYIENDNADFHRRDIIPYVSTMVSPERFLKKS